MPHLHIQHFPRDLTAAETERLSSALTAAILDTFDTTHGAVSISLEPVAKPEWNDTVLPSIVARHKQQQLIKEPTYWRKG
ncbi:tautomerase pptA [Streptomyces sp. NPDC102381]|uniref:tautomerase pptA n=1 Tax=Streptomyces sp. NPDC102381 TaxID=3366164 RepID=UPI0038120C67